MYGPCRSRSAARPAVPPRGREAQSLYRDEKEREDSAPTQKKAEPPKKKQRPKSNLTGFDVSGAERIKELAAFCDKHELVFKKESNEEYEDEDLFLDDMITGSPLLIEEAIADHDHHVLDGERTYRGHLARDEMLLKKSNFAAQLLQTRYRKIMAVTKLHQTKVLLLQQKREGDAAVRMQNALRRKLAVIRIGAIFRELRAKQPKPEKPKKAEPKASPKKNAGRNSPDLQRHLKWRNEYR